MSITKSKMSEKCIFVSFDVSYMFSNIPPDQWFTNGRPPSPLLADIILSYIEQKIMNSYEAINQVKFW